MKCTSMTVIGGLTLSVALTTSSVFAASFTGTTITENFDGLPSSGTQVSPFSATVGVQAAVPGTIFSGTKISGTGTTAMPFTVDNGTSSSGGIFSYGVTAATDRALGELASGSNVASFGVELVNNSAGPLTSVTIGLNSESYRSSTTTLNVLNAQYSVGASGSTTYLSTVGTDIDALDLTGPAPVTTNGAITPTQTAESTTISFAATPIAVGQSFYLRFYDTNDTGNDAGIAVDDFTFSAVVAPTSPATPEPTTLAALAGVAIVGGLRRRRA